MATKKALALLCQISEKEMPYKYKSYCSSMLF